MKVYQNIENYDPAEVVNLDVKGDEKFIADLKVAVDELDKRKTNKRRTRQYFDEALNIDAHIGFNTAVNEYFYGNSGAGEEYTPAPGEFRWFGRFFHPALLKVLEDDANSFGYIVNILRKEEAARKGVRLKKWELISDAAIEYCQKFDIDTIRCKLTLYKTPQEKLDYLNEIKLENDLFCKLNEDEYVDIGQRFEYQFGKVLDSVKEAVDQSKSLGFLEDAPLPDTVADESKGIPVGSLQVSTPENDPFCVPEPTDVFYNPEHITNGRFSPVELRTDFDFWLRQHINSKAFADEIGKSFKNCFLDSKELTWNDDTLSSTSKLISSLYNDFEKRIEEIYGVGNREIYNKINLWVIETRRIIDAAYQSNRTVQYYFIEDAGGGYPEFENADTNEYRDYLYHCVIDSAILGFSSFQSNMPEEFGKMIYYNFWGDDFDKEATKYRGKVGLAQEQRAMVFQKANVDRLKEFVDNRYNKYEADYINDFPYFDEDEDEAHPYEGMPSFFQSQFEDFIKRVNKESSDRVKIDAAIIAWLVDLMIHIANWGSNANSNIRDNDFKADRRREACDYFFLHCGLFPLQDMLNNYFIDSEAVGFIQKDDCETSAEPNIERKAEHSHKYSPKNMPTDLYSNLYEVMESYGANAGLTEPQFIECIENADVQKIFIFKQMTRVRYVLMQLRKFFPDEWGDDICANLNKKREDFFRGYKLDKDFQDDISEIF